MGVIFWCRAESVSFMVIPAQAEIHQAFECMRLRSRWIPAFAGKTI